MKYNWKLDHYENQKAWAKFHENAPRTSYSDLNPEELAQIEAIHLRLREIEAMIYPILKAKQKTLLAKVDEQSHWMEAFNLTLYLTYFLREDDHEWEEDCDNILTKGEYYVWPDNDEWGIGMLHINHAEPGRPFENAHHCYSFHELYDHSYLDWRDLLRIGNIYVEITTDEQGSFPV